MLTFTYPQTCVIKIYSVRYISVIILVNDIIGILIQRTQCFDPIIVISVEVIYCPSAPSYLYGTCMDFPFSLHLLFGKYFSCTIAMMYKSLR